MSNNETLIPIPGRLHSVAVEGNVVGANEVVDDTNYDVPKKQSEINADTALEIENIKAKDSNIESLIPSQATSDNQLADKNFVNSSISTATADFKGTYNTLLELQAVTANANDYGFVVALDVEGNTVYKKYKYIENNGWTFEYDLNNSSFTADQWATIQSGMTAALTNKLVSLPNNTELQEALATINNTLNSKQDVINDLPTIRNKATTAYQKPAGGIPSTDLATGVIPSFTIVDDHSGTGDDPDKIYIPSANAEKELYDNQVFEKGTGTNSAKLKGGNNTVTGDNSVATGEHNYVEGKNSLVAGRYNTVAKTNDYCFGQYNVINASNSTVIGTVNVVSNQNAYAEGRHLRNSGKFSHIEGYGQLNITISGVANSTTYTIVEDLSALFIGSYIGLTVDNGFLHAIITAIDDNNHTITLTKTLNPDSDFVNQSVNLLCSQNLQTAGHVEGKYNLLLINDEITENPLPESVVQDIYDAETSKVGGHIEGFGNIACGKYSHAEGSFNLVNSLNAHVEGAYNKALGYYSHVEGRYCEAHKNFGHAEGSHTIAEGNASHAEGYYTIARGSRSSAKGAYSVAIGNHTESSGIATVAKGTNSHAEGSCNESYGSASHAEGFGNTAWGSCSHVGGDGSLNVVLTGDANATTYNVNIQPKDTWVGRLIKPSNVSSNAVIYISAIDAVNKTITVTESLDTENPITAAIYYIALGGTYHANSFAHGKGVVTGGSEQAVFGRYNLVTANALFVVGNGTSYDNPSNAFYIDANGNVYIAGNIVSTQIQQLESRIAALEAALNNNSNN